MKATCKLWLRSAPILLFPFVILFAITQQTEIPWRYFFLDLPIALRVPVFTFAVTGTTSILWCSSGAIALFASSIGAAADRNSLRLWGWLSLTMGLDDLFMIHENLLPRALKMTEKSVSLLVESGVFLAYGCVLLTWLVLYRKTIPSALYSFLTVSLFCFAMSLAADLASSYKLFGHWSRFRNDYDFQMMVEDGPKLVGVVFWAVFTWYYSRSRFGDSSTPSRVSADANL